MHRNGSRDSDVDMPQVSQVTTPWEITCQCCCEALNARVLTKAAPDRRVRTRPTVTVHSCSRDGCGEEGVKSLPPGSAEYGVAR